MTRKFSILHICSPGVSPAPFQAAAIKYYVRKGCWSKHKEKCLRYLQHALEHAFLAVGRIQSDQGLEHHSEKLEELTGDPRRAMFESFRSYFTGRARVISKRTQEQELMMDQIERCITLTTCYIMMYYYKVESERKYTRPLKYLVHGLRVCRFKLDIQIFLLFIWTPWTT
jgi:hypothetical protein